MAVALEVQVIPQRVGFMAVVLGQQSRQARREFTEVELAEFMEAVPVPQTISKRRVFTEAGHAAARVRLLKAFTVQVHGTLAP